MRPVPSPPRRNIPWPPLRTYIYYADIELIDENGEPVGAKPYLVVSNNARNQSLETCMAARITTTRKDGLNSYVPLGNGDPLVGTVLCDDIVTLFHEDIKSFVGAILLPTMQRVDRGLVHALGLTLEGE